MKSETIAKIQQACVDQQRLNVSAMRCMIEIGKLFPAGEKREPLVQALEDMSKLIEKQFSSLSEALSALDEEA
jgi:predicted component of type VI protein secretion system